MNEDERALVGESATKVLAEAYMLLLKSVGFEEAGRIVGSTAYPALIEVGYIPPVGVPIVKACLGPRGKQLYEGFVTARGEDS